MNCPSPQALVITNTSNVPLTWHVSSNPLPVTITPLGSTLAAGAAVSVSVVPNLGVTRLISTVSIEADVAPSQSIALFGSLNPTVVPPPDIDLGNVPVGSSSPLIFIPLSAWVFTNYPGVGSGSSNPDFQWSGLAPTGHPQGIGWTLRFLPQVLGPQQTTITFITFFSPVCPPNTFTVRGVGVAP